jgi:predicted phage terminase large subunit-like protein
MHHDVALLTTVIRTDFPSFVRMCFQTLNPGAEFHDNWHLAAIGYQLDRVRSGESTRVVINLPPRHLKSLIVSIALPAFLLGHEPWHRIFVISYGAELSDKHASDFRAIVESDWYKRIFPAMRIERIHDNEVITTARGFRKSTTVMGSLTGLGGNLFIIDDPQKTQDALSDVRRNSLNHWVSNTLLSRLDDKQTGVIIVVMQRVHMEDLSGYLLESSSGYEHLNLSAVAEVDERVLIGNNEFHFRGAGEALQPHRESLATLERLRQEVGSDVFAAQYQQSPVPAGGNMIKRQWLRYYDVPPARTYGSRIVQSWDTAAKEGAQNSWSVCTTFQIHDKHFYLLDVTRGRYEYPRLRDTAVRLAERFKPNVVLIEDASTGIALAQELGRIVHRPVRLIPVDRDKRGRLYVEQAKFEAGLVLFPRGAAFLGELEIELLRFPQGKHDDQVDSISQALAHGDSGYDSTMSWVRGPRKS